MYSVNIAIFAALWALQGVQAGLSSTSSSNIAIYWGQNSYGESSGDLAQQDLAYYCENSDIDVIQLAFLTVINGEGGAPEINFANSGNDCSVFDGTDLLDCPTIGEDITTCQGLGKTILLSIGGSTYSEGGFSSTEAAIAGAQLLWQTFGPVSSDTSINRPFGDAVVDGFDFDFESTVDNMPTFANELRTLFAEDTSKTYFLTAAPQCPYPDVADNPMLDGTVYFDAIWVQFYNNYCGINSYVAGSTTQDDFNFDTWDTWAKSTSLNPDVKVFLGIPGDTTAASSGYESASTITSIVDFIQTSGYSSFGGVMIWDASQVYANSGFLSGIASALGSSSAASSTSTTKSSTTITTVTSTTSTSTTSTSTTSTSTTTTSTLVKTTTSATIAAKTTTTITTTTKAPTTLFTTTKATTKATIKATTTSTTTAAAVTTALASSRTCPTKGESCPVSGEYLCNGSSFGVCDNGVWAIQQCATGLVCVQDGSFIYCDFKNDHPDTTCS